jgi:hypothetical protein
MPRRCLWHISNCVIVFDDAVLQSHYTINYPTLCDPKRSSHSHPPTLAPALELTEPLVARPSSPTGSSRCRSECSGVKLFPKWSSAITLFLHDPDSCGAYPGRLSCGVDWSEITMIHPKDTLYDQLGRVDLTVALALHCFGIGINHESDSQPRIDTSLRAGSHIEVVSGLGPTSFCNVSPRTIIPKIADISRQGQRHNWLYFSRWLLT